MNSLPADPLAQTAKPTIVETQAATDPPIWVHDEWRSAFPWLVQGVTGRAAGEPYDMSLFGATPTSVIQSRWAALQQFAGMRLTVHARQVHGSVVLRHARAGDGLLVTRPADGHMTGQPGVLLTVSVADCVPISIVNGRHGAIALLHGGWRGIAAGILERGVAALTEHAGSDVSDLHVHLGPSICGECYEVGPEVHHALGSHADGALPIDLRALLAARAAALGVPSAQITISSHCTRCGSGFHSHRGGARERQIAVLGVRPEAGA